MGKRTRLSLQSTKQENSGHKVQCSMAHNIMPLGAKLFVSSDVTT